MRPFLTVWMVAQYALITADNSDKGESLSFAETFFRDKTELGIDYCKYAQNNCYRGKKSCVNSTRECWEMTSEWFNAAYDIAKSLAEQCSADDKERTMSCNDECTQEYNDITRIANEAFENCTANPNSCESTQEQCTDYCKANYTAWCMEHCPQKSVDCNTLTPLPDDTSETSILPEIPTTCRDMTLTERCESACSDEKYIALCKQGGLAGSTDCRTKSDDCVNECDKKKENNTNECKETHESSLKSADTNKGSCEQDCDETLKFWQTLCREDIPSKCLDPQCLQDRASICNHTAEMCQLGKSNLCGKQANQSENSASMDECTNGMESCFVGLHECFAPPSNVCDQVFPTAEEREQKCRANDSKQLFGCLYAPLCNPEKEYLSEKKTSACKWQNVTEADRQEIAIRRQYLSRSRESNYSVQTIDRYGNIILDGGYHQSVQFPLLLKVSEATLEVSVCELPESECEPLDTEEDRLTLFRIIFENKSTCDVDTFKTESGPLGGQGRCRNGTWSIHNAIGSAKFLVSIASNKKCKLIVEIKSTPFEHCFADWTPIFTRYNNDNVTEEHTLKITVGTNHRGRNEPSKDEEIYSLSKIAGQGKVLKLGGNSVVKDYFVHSWQKEREKSFTDGNGTKFQVSMLNNYSHSVNKKLNFSMNIAEKSNLYTNVVIPPGRGVRINQLKIICTVIQHQSQFFLSDQMEWEPNVTILTDATTVDNSFKNNSAVTGAPTAESTKHQDSGVGHVSNDFFIFQWMLTISAFSFLIDAYLL